MTTTKYTEEQQNQIDRCWNLYNKAMDQLHSLMEELDELGQMGIDTSKPTGAAGEAHSRLDEAYSEGASILPPHTSDMIGE